VRIAINGNPNSTQDISKLGGGEGFQKSTRPQVRYQTSSPKNHKTHHAST